MFEFNKKLIFKKFFLDNTYYFLLSIFCLTLIVWVIQAVNYLDFVTEDGHGLGVYFKYMLFSIPKIVSKLMLLIFFITFFYTLNKFEDSNELKIFWLNGINVKRFIINILNYSAIFVLIHIILTVFIVPSSQNKARTFIQSSNIDFFPSLISERKFIDTVEGLTIYIQNKSNYQNYDNIFLKDNKEKDKVKIIYAKKGMLESDNEKPKLIKKKKSKYIQKKDKGNTWIKKKKKKTSEKGTIDLSNATEADVNNNGVIDAWLIDKNNNNIYEKAYADQNEDGVIEIMAIDKNEDGNFEVILIDTNNNGNADEAEIDEDEDGKTDIIAYDFNEDGEWDKFENV